MGLYGFSAARSVQYSGIKCSFDRELFSQRLVRRANLAAAAVSCKYSSAGMIISSFLEITFLLTSKP